MDLVTGGPVAAVPARCAAATVASQPHPHPGEHMLKPIRRLIESVNDTLRANSTSNYTAPGPAWPADWKIAGAMAQVSKILVDAAPGPVSDSIRRIWIDDRRSVGIPGAEEGGIQMSPIAVIVLIIVILVVIAATVFVVRASRRKQLQQTFGPEYDRVVADTGSRADAEKELREREKRHAELELKPLSPESQARYATAWEEVQIQFVDSPEEAVTRADELVTELIAERGYPTGDYDDQLANLSVNHARTLGHYRDAHAISERSRNGEASTEDLRQALVHYRALFADLLGTEPVKADTTDTTTGTRNTATTTAGTPTGATTADTPNTTATGTPNTTTAAGTPAASTGSANAPTTASGTPTQRTGDSTDDDTRTSTAPDTDVAGSRPDATSR
jgi:hypothetical protein